MSCEVRVLELFFNEYYNLDEISMICQMPIVEVKKILANYITNNIYVNIPNTRV